MTSRRYEGEQAGMSFSTFIGSMAIIALASFIALGGWFNLRNPDASDGDKLSGFALLAGGVYPPPEPERHIRPQRMSYAYVSP